MPQLQNDERKSNESGVKAMWFRTMFIGAATVAGMFGTVAVATAGPSVPAYVCDTAHLVTAACDVATLGQEISPDRASAALVNAQSLVERGVDPLPTRVPAPAREAGSGQYTVRAGDTLSGIAQARGVSVRDLVRLNPVIVNPNRIRAGQVINV